MIEALKLTQEEDFGYRRVVKRVSCYLMGNCATTGNVSCQARCYDISSKGAALITSVPLRINSQVKVQVNTRYINGLPFEGKVCWCKKLSNSWRVGIAFNRDLPFDVKRIV